MFVVTKREIKKYNRNKIIISEIRLWTYVSRVGRATQRRSVIGWEHSARPFLKFQYGSLPAKSSLCVKSDVRVAIFYTMRAQTDRMLWNRVVPRLTSSLVEQTSDGVFLYRRRAKVRACPRPWRPLTIPECAFSASGDSFPSVPWKSGHKRTALFLKHSGCQFCLVIKLFYIQKIQNRSRTSCFWIHASDNNAGQPRLNDCSCAHLTCSNVTYIVHCSSSSLPFFCLPFDCLNLRMCQRVFICIPSVITSAYDLPS